MEELNKLLELYRRMSRLEWRRSEALRDNVDNEICSIATTIELEESKCLNKFTTGAKEDILWKLIPTPVEAEYYGMGGRCPTCHAMVKREYHDAFCGNCGQTLVWEGEENYVAKKRGLM